MQKARNISNCGTDDPRNKKNGITHHGWFEGDHHETACFCSNRNLGICDLRLPISRTDIHFDRRGHRVKVWWVQVSRRECAANCCFASVYRHHLTVRNGTISGFAVGASLAGETIPYISKNHLIEYIHADQNRYSAFNDFGDAIVVRHNQVTDTGSTSRSYARAMYVIGKNSRVIDNDITGTVANLDATAITVQEAEGTVLENNRIGTVTNGTTYGIRIWVSTVMLVVGNRITNVDYGVYFDGSTGKYRDNLTFNVTTPFTGGTDAGGND
jgi:hypothetical protein